VIRAGIGGTGLWQLTGEEIGRYVLSSVIPFLFFMGELVEPQVWVSSQVWRRTYVQESSKNKYFYSRSKQISTPSYSQLSHQTSL
jgi:hypothetical protein